MEDNNAHDHRCPVCLVMWDHTALTLPCWLKKAAWCLSCLREVAAETAILQRRQERQAEYLGNLMED